MLFFSLNRQQTRGKNVKIKKKTKKQKPKKKQNKKPT